MMMMIIIYIRYMLECSHLFIARSRRVRALISSCVDFVSKFSTYYIYSNAGGGSSCKYYCNAHLCIWFFLIYLHTKHSSSFFFYSISTSYTTRRPHKLQCFVFFRPSQHKPFEFQIKHLHLQRKCNYIAHTDMALATNIIWWPRRANNKLTSNVFTHNLNVCVWVCIM